MLAKQIRREINLIQVGRDLLEVELLIELNLELRLEVVCAEVEAYLRVFVACDGFLFIDYGVGEGRIEGVVEDALGFVLIIDGAVEIDEEALVRVGNP